LAVKKILIAASSQFSTSIILMAISAREQYLFNFARDIKLA